MSITDEQIFQCHEKKELHEALERIKKCDKDIKQELAAVTTDIEKKQAALKEHQSNLDSHKKANTEELEAALIKSDIQTDADEYENREKVDIEAADKLMRDLKVYRYGAKLLEKTAQKEHALNDLSVLTQDDDAVSAAFTLSRDEAPASP